MMRSMPFDVRDFSGLPPGEKASSRHNRRLVALWLFGVAFMILMMVVLGGVTRLTGSGLSIMEWAPISGILPPLDQAEWQKLFDLYQQIPQYALVNQGFGLAGFKQIFWLEWIHRLWGRLIGLAFLVPLIWMWATGRIERRLRPRLLCCSCSAGCRGRWAGSWLRRDFCPTPRRCRPTGWSSTLCWHWCFTRPSSGPGSIVLRPHSREAGRCARRSAG